MTREWNSSTYDRISGPQVSWGKKVLSRVALGGDETLLDAGCGTGRLTADLLEALPKGRVIGLDLSQNMLRTARENLEPRFCGRLQVVAADLLSLPFDQVFDGVFSTAAFHWVMDHDRLFEQLFHALIPGGWLIAQCGGGPNLARLRDRANHLMASPKFATFFDGFVEPWLYSDAESAGERLCRAGFMEVETSLEAAPTVLEDASHFSEFIESVIFHRHLERIPDQASRGQLIAELTAAGASDDPPYSLDYWRLNLSGKKPRA
ncbi:MAG TPA: class I SAM-dependent methyltransferase [Terriglobales bacterium]|jgi:SAM-dependent methyltransferase